MILMRMWPHITVFFALVCAELVLECEGASQTNTCDPWRMSKISEFEQRIASIHR